MRDKGRPRNCPWLEGGRGRDTPVRCGVLLWPLRCRDGVKALGRDGEPGGLRPGSGAADAPVAGQGSVTRAENTGEAGDRHWHDSVTTLSHPEVKVF